MSLDKLRALLLSRLAGRTDGRPAGATPQAREVGDPSPTVSICRATPPRALVAATDRGAARL